MLGVAVLSGTPPATAMASQQQKSLFSFFGGRKSGSAKPTVKCATSPLSLPRSSPAATSVKAVGLLTDHDARRLRRPSTLLSPTTPGAGASIYQYQY